VAMAEQRGRHFDPDLLDAFLADYQGFCDIALRFPDEPEQRSETSAGTAAGGTAGRA